MVFFFIFNQDDGNNNVTYNETPHSNSNNSIEGFNKDINKMKKSKMPFFRPVFIFFILD
jgi:hypothetical protein